MITSLATWQLAARPGARVGHTIEAHETIGSTNDRARELLEADAPHGVVVVAEVQTAGRGRMGRGWTSPPGRNLTASIGIRPALPASDAWQIGLAAALAVHGATRRHADVGLKWPNDLVAPHGAKVAGLLVEAVSEGGRIRHAVIGAGINVNWRPEEMPPELAGRATSLGTLAGERIDRVELLRHLLEAVDRELSSIDAGRSPLARYRESCVTIGSRVAVETPGGRLEGLALDVEAGGALLVRSDDGTVVPILSGEVTRVRSVGGA